ncbi:zinc finger protein ZAT5-like [Phalaenopsis equestris]|uniref:zinc finger protein ZAT5-like n=1 Tax=Phalaenopsis equestris TaxID=78828 RepID=UPI0009E540FE|nr:zinc finger protein ZAT5-like [Phalaenopsis equestris]
MEGILVKRKRTKRQRPQLSSSAASPVFSPTTSAEFSETTTEEEEDLANCLMLLSRGGHQPEPYTTPALKFTIRRSAELTPPTTTTAKAGSSIHECETCHKCFNSHQALGGHRSSHKKSKLSIPQASAKRSKMAVMNEASIQLSMNSFPSAAVAKVKVHQCTRCGAEFSSGQALGGHMRRHRQEMEKEDGKQNGLALDLNLPPPSEDDGDAEKVSSSHSSASVRKSPSLSFATKRPIFMISSSLVGCQY